MGYKQLLERMKAYEIKHRPLKEDLTIDGQDDKDEGLTIDDSIASTEPPKDDIDNGVAQTLNDLIVDEWEAVSGYNDAIAMFRSLSEEFPDKDFSDNIEVLSDIVKEENIHIGQLQKIMQKFSPNAEQIEVGEKEAEIQTEG
jgi:rubrerythrin